MSLSKKLLITLVFFIFSSGSQSSIEGDEKFVFMNNPETLKTTGILHQKKFSQDSTTRYFFHYKNGTNQPQKFKILSTATIRNIKFGCDIDERPEAAGPKALRKFLSSKNHDEKLNFTRVLKPNFTVTGIIEGEFKKDTNIKFQLGDTEKIIAKDKFQNEYSFDINLGLDFFQTTKYRLGENIKGAIPGQYGSNVNLIIKPANSGIMKFEFSPRGGQGLLIFTYRGRIFSTDVKSAYKKAEVMYIYVEKDRLETITFIPIGGFNYPIELIFSLHNEILKDITG